MSFRNGFILSLVLFSAGAFADGSGCTTVRFRDLLIEKVALMIHGEPVAVLETEWLAQKHIQKLQALGVCERNAKCSLKFREGQLSLTIHGKPHHLVENISQAIEKLEDLSDAGVCEAAVGR